MKHPTLLPLAIAVIIFQIYALMTNATPIPIARDIEKAGLKEEKPTLDRFSCQITDPSSTVTVAHITRNTMLPQYTDIPTPNIKRDSIDTPSISPRIAANLGNSLEVVGGVFDYPSGILTRDRWYHSGPLHCHGDRSEDLNQVEKRDTDTGRIGVNNGLSEETDEHQPVVRKRTARNVRWVGVGNGFVDGDAGSTARRSPASEHNSKRGFEIGNGVTSNAPKGEGQDIESIFKRDPEIGRSDSVSPDLEDEDEGSEPIFRRDAYVIAKANKKSGANIVKREPRLCWGCYWNSVKGAVDSRGGILPEHDR